MKDYSRTEIKEAIDEWVVGRNAHRDRAVLRSRLIDGFTYEALAEQYDMSVAQIKRIIYKRQEVLFRHLK